MELEDNKRKGGNFISTTSVSSKS